jgi:hypothetical protein
VVEEHHPTRSGEFGQKLDKEYEKTLLKRKYMYWSADAGRFLTTEICTIVDNAKQQLGNYINTIAKGPVKGHSIQEFYPMKSHIWKTYGKHTENIWKSLNFCMHMKSIWNFS